MILPAGLPRSDLRTRGEHERRSAQGCVLTSAVACCRATPPAAHGTDPAGTAAATCRRPRAAAAPQPTPGCALARPCVAGLHCHRCSAVAQNKSTCTCNGAAAATQRAEIRHQIRRLSHHPSIVLWDAVNEAGGFGVSAARIFRLATDSFSPPRCFDFSHCRTYRDSCLRRL